VLLDQIAMGTEPPLPRLLQRAGHQPILGLHGLVLPPRPVGLEPGTLQLLQPLALGQVELALQVGGDAEADLQLPL